MINFELSQENKTVEVTTDRGTFTLSLDEARAFAREMLTKIDLEG